jgi:probable phosphoglycerate mutase
VAVLDANGEPLEEHNGLLGRATNNVAEYSALIEALKLADARGARKVEILSDSELIVRQIQGSYRVKHPDLQPLYRQARQLIGGFASFQIRHVRRKDNKHADGLVNAALDEAQAAAPAREEAGSP